MNSEELDAIRKRNERLGDDPRWRYQSGCAGTHIGKCGEGRHHHHDDRCEPSPYELMGALIAEVERLQTEIRVGDQLLADRLRILDALPCPAHGPCVPYVMNLISARTFFDTDRT